MRQIKRLPQIDGDLGWLETAPDPAAALGPRLKGDHEFDIVVVGAGYTGLSCALRLAEIDPEASIAIVDALRVGQGASGRNAGFLIDLPHNVNFKKAGIEYAHALTRLNQFGIERLRRYKEQYAIASWVEAGKYMAGHEPGNLHGLDHFADMLSLAGFAYEVVAGDALARRLGTDYYHSAIYTRGSVLVNPAELVRGLVKTLPSSVALFENSPVQGIEYGPPHTLQFLGGTIKARIVVQAVNAFAAQFGKLPNRIAPIFTYASLTRPLTDAECRTHFNGVPSWGLTSAHQAGATVRFTHDKRIFVRTHYDHIPGLQASRQHLQSVWHRHRAAFEARFPFIKNVPFEYTWGGMFCVTANFETVFTGAGNGIYILSGCNGVGVVRGTYAGYYMADYICGIQSENLKLIQTHANPPWIPPDPFLGIGVNARIAWAARSSRGDA